MQQEKHPTAIKEYLKNKYWEKNLHVGIKKKSVYKNISNLRNKDVNEEMNEENIPNHLRFTYKFLCFAGFATKKTRYRRFLQIIILIVWKI